MTMLDENLKVYPSSINKRLKIRWVDGKKVLDTRNTNYSYGGLQEVLNRGLRVIPIHRVNSVLVLGMGGGCVVDSLRNEFEYNGPIVGVEIDPVVIEIAHNEFDLLEYKNVDLIQADAKKYVESLDKKYDLIIVDIFIDINVPEKFYSPSFWQDIESIVSDNGFVLFNAGIDMTRKKRKKFIEIIPDSFVYTKKLNVLRSNTVFVLQKVF